MPEAEFAIRKGGIFMIDNNLFAHSMNVSSRNIASRIGQRQYLERFAARREEKSSENVSYIQKLIEQSTKNLYGETGVYGKKLSSLSEQLEKSVSEMEKALAPDEKTDEQDYGKAYSAAEDFVKSYNDLAKEIGSSNDRTVSGKSRFLSNMTLAYSRKLEKVGIDVGKDGMLSLDKDRFDRATASELDGVFGKKGSFSSFLSEQSKQLSAYAEAERLSRANAYTQSGGITNIANISGSFFSMLG